MKIAYQTNLFLLLCALPVFALARPGMVEFYQLQEEIRTYYDAGNYAGALEKHLELRDLDINYNIAPHVRVSFVLGDWMELTSVYPEAKKALLDIKQELTSQILAGKVNYMYVTELDSINAALDKRQDTVDVFLAIEKSYPDEAASAYLFMEDSIIQQQRFDIVKRHLSDPIYKYESARFSREGELSNLRTQSTPDDDFVLQSANRRFVSEVLQLISLSQRIGMPDVAKEIHRRALAYYPDDKIKQALSAAK